MTIIDYMMFAVAILSASVMILIGWQVVNFFTLEGRIKKLINRKIENAKTCIEKDTEDTVYRELCFSSLSTLSHIHLHLHCIQIIPHRGTSTI